MATQTISALPLPATLRPAALPEVYVDGRRRRDL
jgi:hypothetical protein